MAESWEHRNLKNLLGVLLGATECQTPGGRVDACSPFFTAEVECGPKKNDERTCRIDFRRKPDVKNRGTRQKPLASFYVNSRQIEAIVPILNDLRGQVSGSPT